MSFKSKLKTAFNTIAGKKGWQAPLDIALTAAAIAGAAIAVVSAAPLVAAFGAVVAVWSASNVHKDVKEHDAQNSIIDAAKTGDMAKLEKALDEGGYKPLTPAKTLATIKEGQTVTVEQEGKKPVTVAVTKGKPAVSKKSPSAN